MTDVGRAEVEVKGDVRDFARQTQQDLDSALSKIKLDPLEVPVDTEGISKSGEEAGAKLGEGITRGADGRLRDSRGKFVKSGEEAGRAAGEGVGKGVGDSLGRGKFSSFLANAFKPHKGAFDALRAPLTAALSTPVGAAVAAVAGTAAVAFVAAFAAAIATAGLGAVFLGIGAAALFGAKKSRDEAQKDLDEAEERVRKAQERAKSGTAAAKRSLAEARAELAKAQAAVEDNAAFEKLDGSLKRLGDTLKEVGQRAASPLIKPFTAALNSLSKAAERIEPLLKKIFTGLAPAIQPLTDGMAGFVEEFLKVLTADPKTLEGMRDALIAVGENLPRLGTLFGEVFAMFASNENNVRNIGLLFGAFASSVMNVALVIYGLSKVLDGLIIAWNAIRNAGSATIDWITGTAVPAIAGFFSTIGSMISSFVASVAEKLAPLTPIFSGMWQAISSAVSAAWQIITSTVSTSIAVVKGVMAAVSAAISGSWAGTWAGIKNVIFAVWGNIRSIVTAAMNGIKGVITGAITAIKGAWSASLSGMSAAASSSFAVVKAGISALGSVWVAGWNRMISTVRAAAATIRSVVTGLANTIRGAFAAAGSWLVSAGRAIIDGLIRGIKSGFGRVKGVLDSLTSMLPSWKGPAEVDRRILERSGELVMAGFERGLESRFASVQKTLEGLTADLPSFTVGRPRGGDGASLGQSLSIGEIHVHVSGVSGREAGIEAAEAVLERLGQATLAR